MAPLMTLPEGLEYQGNRIQCVQQKADQPASDGAGTRGSPRAGIFPESSGPKPRDEEDDEHRPQDPSPA